MEALQEIGCRKMLKYAWGQIIISLLKSELLLPPFRSLLLRACGARVGKASIVQACTFFNAYRKGFKGLSLGHHCFIGNETLFDLAGTIDCGNHVTMAERVTIITHTNVGYASHPLQTIVPSITKGVRIENGVFIGTNATILPGITIGKESIIAAGAMVREDVPSRCLVAGVPARVVRQLDDHDTATAAMANKAL